MILEYGGDVQNSSVTFHFGPARAQLRDWQVLGLDLFSSVGMRSPTRYTEYYQLACLTSGPGTGGETVDGECYKWCLWTNLVMLTKCQLNVKLMIKLWNSS